LAVGSLCPAIYPSTPNYTLQTKATAPNTLLSSVCCPLREIILLMHLGHQITIHHELLKLIQFNTLHTRILSILGYQSLVYPSITGQKLPKPRHFSLYLRKTRRENGASYIKVLPGFSDIALRTILSCLDLHSLYAPQSMSADFILLSSKNP
jgi:hypothetical protein